MTDIATMSDDCPVAEARRDLAPFAKQETQRKPVPFDCRGGLAQ
jgi:hypothetical protein